MGSRRKTLAPVPELMTPVKSAVASAPTGTPVSANYWRASREPRYSILFAMPLFALYELLVLAIASGPRSVRNGADVLLTEILMAAGGARAPAIGGAAVIVLALWLVRRDVKRVRGGVRSRVFLLMLAESAFLAIAFGIIVGTVTAQLLHAAGALAIGAGTARLSPVAAAAQLPISQRLMLSLGAGLFEELLFRVLVVSLVAGFARVVLGWSTRLASATAVVISALVFSAFHYIGSYGDPLELNSFVFRAIAGLAFSLLYVTRGFGITAWTHALYDIYVMVL